MTQTAGTRPSVRRERSWSDPIVRLQHGLDVLPALVAGCHHATITTVSAGRLHVCVASDPTGRRADELQDEFGEGPCLQAVRTGHSVVAYMLPTETRWADWCAAAVSELQVSSAVSVLIQSSLRPMATLNLYSDRAEGLSGVDIGLLHSLVDPMAGALLDARLVADRLGPAA